MESTLVVGTFLTALGTLALAVATFWLAILSRGTVKANREMVDEMRDARIAQDRPQVIVDTDHSKPPRVYVVVRNIGKGAAKDISFEFSAPMEIPRGASNPSVVPISEQPYFKRGMDYLAPGAEISTFWGAMPDLAPFLRERGLHDGVTITSRYKSLSGEQYETPWVVNPLLIASRLS